MNRNLHLKIWRMSEEIALKVLNLDKITQRCLSKIIKIKYTFILIAFSVR